MIVAQTLIGEFDEPFLDAALRSVHWVDAFAVVNTGADTPGGRRNREIVLGAVPVAKLRYVEYHPGAEGFSFADARNLGLSQIEDGAFVMWLDSDDVHTPEWEGICHYYLLNRADSITAWFYHMVVYRDAVQAVFPREVVYRKGPGTRWINRVHETLLTTRNNPVEADYRWFHASYIRGQRSVFDRWKRYAELDGDPHHYDGQNPDTIISDRVSVARRLEVEWPEVAAEAIAQVPFCPHALGDERPWDPPKVGFVMIWRDDDTVELRERALATFASTVGEAAELLYLDGNAASLCESLNEGFSHFRDRGFDYIGWVHPDMRFDEPDWLDGLLTELRCWPRIGKVCAANTRDALPMKLIDGHEQCYLIRRLVLDEVGLFDEGYKGIGGFEDWDMNRRIINAGWRVVITPRSRVFHAGMATRSKRDTDADARANAAYYAEKWGSNAAPV